jgi:hypothetical protein
MSIGNFSCSFVMTMKLLKRETRLYRLVAHHIPRQLRFLCCWRSRARRCASRDGRSSELCGLDSLVLDECGALAAKSATGDGLDRRTAARASQRHQHRRPRKKNELCASEPSREVPCTTAEVAGPQALTWALIRAAHDSSRVRPQSTGTVSRMVKVEGALVPRSPRPTRRSISETPRSRGTGKYTNAQRPTLVRHLSVMCPSFVRHTPPSRPWALCLSTRHRSTESRSSGPRSTQTSRQRPCSRQAHSAHIGACTSAASSEHRQSAAPGRIRRGVQRQRGA